MSATDDPEVIDVRSGEELDVARIEPYLREVLHQRDGAFAIRQFGGGHANLTYLVSFGENEFVLRRPPLGPIPAHAHDMRREYNVLSKLYRVFPLAPRAYHLCTDERIAGSDFIVEERRQGIAIRRELPPNIAGDPDAQRRLGFTIVDTLAALHRIDPVEAGLEALGRPDGYVHRQVVGWTARWLDARTSGSIDCAELAEWLRTTMPQSGGAALVHNDFKLDNLLMRPDDPAQCSAVLDWDMCTLGDPLMDFGFVLALWVEPGDPPLARAGSMPTWHGGFPTRHEVVERYGSLTGFDLSHVKWYYVFNLFRFAVILQQIFFRYHRGQTQDERFRHFGAQANALIATATSLIQ